MKKQAEERELQLRKEREAELEIKVSTVLEGATFKANLKECEDKRRHDRFVFERRLAKDNERERRKRQNKTLGVGDGNDPTLDTIDTISEDIDEDFAEVQR